MRHTGYYWVRHKVKLNSEWQIAKYYSSDDNWVTESGEFKEDDFIEIDESIILRSKCCSICGDEIGDNCFSCIEERMKRE